VAFGEEIAMSLYEMIKDMPLFNSFSEKELKSFSKMDHVMVEYRAGDTIIREGDELRGMYLLIKGNILIVKRSEGHPIRLAKLKPGEIFGEMSLFSSKPRQSDVVANDDVTVLRMDDAFFEKLKPAVRDKVKDYMIGLLVNRLDSMNDSLMTVSKLIRG
jgi:CRP-like cAMP-binding protein